MLYLMLGYPGAGKTTTAKVIHRLTGAEHLWADHERRIMFTNPTHSHEENLALYDVLNKRTGDLLAEGKSVIFDTNFNFYKDREKLRRIAAENNAITKLIWITTPKTIAKTRATENAHHQQTRVLGDMSISDFERMAHNLEPPKEGEDYIAVDGTRITDDYIRELLT